MKIVAMLPFKNEEWVLPAYISSLSKIADEIKKIVSNEVDIYNREAIKEWK